MNIRAKSEPIVEDRWQETIDKFIDQKHIFKDFITEFKQFQKVSKIKDFNGSSLIGK